MASSTSKQLPSQLSTERLNLTLISRSNPAHSACMLACFNSPTTYARMGDYGIRTEAQFNALNDSVRLSAFPDIDICYMISLKSSKDELIGGISLAERTKDLAPDMGWALREGYMGKGYATEAAREVLRVLREEVGIRDICTWPSEGNKESNRVAEKLGFVDGGVVRVRDEGGKEAKIWILEGMERIREGLEIGMWGESK